MGANEEELERRRRAEKEAMDRQAEEIKAERQRRSEQEWMS
jgi:hypothetical protein